MLPGHFTAHTLFTLARARTKAWLITVYSSASIGVAVIRLTMAVRNRSHSSFLRHLKALETAITDPGGLATSLYEKGLIDRLAWQRANNTQSTAVLERSRELLQKVEVKIENDEAAFDTFLSILSTDPTKEEICRRLRTTRGTDSCTKKD